MALPHLGSYTPNSFSPLCRKLKPVALNQEGGTYSAIKHYSAYCAIKHTSTTVFLLSLSHFNLLERISATQCK